jgi:hypothetical protein
MIKINKKNQIQSIFEDGGSRDINFCDPLYRNKQIREDKSTAWEKSTAGLVFYCSIKKE